MKLGFTGTREGMTIEQFRAFRHLVTELRPTEFHHGCCVGSDSDAFDIVQEYAPGCKVVAHPPINKSLISPNVLAFSDEKRERKPYLDRDQDIVDECDHLAATPKSEEEQRRSGTWATVRMARRAGKPVSVICPDGTTTVETP